MFSFQMIVLSKCAIMSIKRSVRRSVGRSVSRVSVECLSCVCRCARRIEASHRAALPPGPSEYTAGALPPDHPHPRGLRPLDHLHFVELRPLKPLHIEGCAQILTSLSLATWKCKREAYPPRPKLTLNFCHF